MIIYKYEYILKIIFKKDNRFNIKSVICVLSLEVSNKLLQEISVRRAGDVIFFDVE